MSHNPKDNVTETANEMDAKSKGYQNRAQQRAVEKALDQQADVNSDSLGIAHGLMGEKKPK